MIKTIRRVLTILKTGDDPNFPVNGKLERLEADLRALNHQAELEREKRR